MVKATKERFVLACNTPEAFDSQAEPVIIYFSGFQAIMVPV
jgi:hypothetical protein